MIMLQVHLDRESANMFGERTEDLPLDSETRCAVQRWGNLRVEVEGVAREVDFEYLLLGSLAHRCQQWSMECIRGSAVEFMAHFGYDRWQCIAGGCGVLVDMVPELAW